jgi:hypothetical protein
MGPSGWGDSRGAVDNIPWCPGEPNNLQSNESCTNVLTHCAPGSPTALLNDYDCQKLARVLCMVDWAAECTPRASCSCVHWLIPKPAAQLTERWSLAHSGCWQHSASLSRFSTANGASHRSS